jgi:hypothetical protein
VIEERTVPAVRHGGFLELKNHLDAGGVWVVRLRRR